MGDKHSGNLGWLLSPTESSNIDVTAAMPEVVSSLEGWMKSLRHELGLNGNYCGSLTSCGTYSGGCPNLTSCTSFHSSIVLEADQAKTSSGA